MILSLKSLDRGNPINQAVISEGVFSGIGGVN
jgi:hypothetical protein